MITKEQMQRSEKEFASAAALSVGKARDLERSLEQYTYNSGRNYDPARRQRILEDFQDADYEAESRAWILSLIRIARGREGIPHNAICLFPDGDKMCAVFGDFVDLQSSPAGFGNNFEEAILALQAENVRQRHEPALGIPVS